MKKIILFLTFGVLLTNSALAVADCFLLKENNQIIREEGDCKSRHAPCSTFKIAISLMGYNEGILIDEIHPELPFKEGYADFLDVWQQPHNPTSWIKNSCVWYSQLITEKLGVKKFNNYLTKFNYGNKDISGDQGKNNGLTHSWLSSSIQISPFEQIIFLQKLIDNRFSVSQKAHNMTKKILFVEDLLDGWKLYGKTGNGCLLNKDGTKNEDRQIGWYIGWIHKDNRTIIFVNYLEDQEKQGSYASIRAKEAAKKKLKQLIQDNNKL
jgi:beta-lactamase class D